MNPQEKIEFVAQQISELREGNSNKLYCPYCTGKCRPYEEFCCRLMESCVKAVLDADRVINEVRLQEAIAEACGSPN